jgi:hypothetical protein
VVAAAGLEAMVRRRRSGAEAGAERGEEGGLGHGGREKEMGKAGKGGRARSKVEKLEPWWWVRGDRRD